MAIEPHILIPSAAIAVFAMVFFIRLIAGPRNALLTEADLRSYLSKEETGVEIQQLIISEDQRCALVELKDEDPLRLFRAFGDKIVMQSLNPEDLNFRDNLVSIPRKDVSHSAITFKMPSQSTPIKWQHILNKETVLEMNL